MAETKKLRFKISRGYNGTIIRAGATVEISAFWAKQFIGDGTAEEVTETKSAGSTAKSKENNGGRNRS